MKKLIKQNYPANIKEDILQEMANGTKKGIENAILLAVGIHGKLSKKEVKEKTFNVQIVAALYLATKNGLLETDESLEKIKFFGGKTKYKSIKMICLNKNCNEEFNSDLDRCPYCGFNNKMAVEQIANKEGWGIKN